MTCLAESKGLDSIPAHPVINLGDMEIVEPEKINQTQQRYEKSKYEYLDAKQCNRSSTGSKAWNGRARQNN